MLPTSLWGCPHRTSWESERLSDWSKVTQLVSDRARIWAQAAQLQSLYSWPAHHIPVKALWSERLDPAFSFCHSLFHHTELLSLWLFNESTAAYPQAVMGIQWDQVSPLPQIQVKGTLLIMVRQVPICLKTDLLSLRCSPLREEEDLQYSFTEDTWNCLCIFSTIVCKWIHHSSDHCFVLFCDFLMIWAATLNHWLPGLFFCLLPTAQSVTAS